MIYLVSDNKTLFSPNKYKQVDFYTAFQILYPLKIVQFDTETTGLDAHSKKLLTVQLGNKQNQVVFDWFSLSISEKQVLKEYFESDRLFLTWNGMFDLGFLYKENIWLKHIWDGMIAEKLIWLGYPAGMHEMSLKAAAMHYLNYDLDKSVRGKIINEGLTEEVVVYAAGDVMWLEDIKEKQDIELDKQDLQRAVRFECEFLKSLAYFKHCGVYLNVDKWQEKMDKDLARFKAAEKALNDWVVSWHLKQQADENSKSILVDYIFENVGWGKTIKYPLNLPEGSYLVSKREKPLSDQTYQVINTYKVPLKNAFIHRELQGSLFDGFDTEPKCTINWASSQQVIKLFEVLGIEVNTFDKKTKKEKKSIEEKQIAPQKDRFEIIPLFLEYQKAAKVVSTYGQNWLNAVNKSTGRIHPDYYSIGTDTSRVSSGGGLSGINA